MTAERIVLLAGLAVLAVLFHVMPALTRAGLFFAVTTETGFHETRDGRAILRRYRTMVWSAAVVGALWELVPGMWAEAGGMVLLLAGFVWALVDAHKRAMAYAVPGSSVREVDLAAPREGFPGGMAVWLAPVVSLVVLALWVGGNWERLPQRLAVHWDIHGADRWVPTSAASVAGLFVGAGTVALLLVALAWGVFHWSRRLATCGVGGASERRFRRRIALLLIAAAVWVTLPAWFAVLQAPATAVTVSNTLALAAMAGFLVNLIRAGQGGSRLAPAAATADRTPDSCWKWGLIYVNPADPSILVEKRFGIGYTINFGNVWSWVGLAALTIAVAAAKMLLH
jgi:uncharacterized membrane protein